MAPGAGSAAGVVRAAGRRKTEPETKVSVARGGEKKKKRGKRGVAVVFYLATGPRAPRPGFLFVFSLVPSFAGKCGS